MQASEHVTMRCFLWLCAATLAVQGCGSGANARFLRTAADPGPLRVRAPEQVAVWRGKPTTGRPVIQLGIIEGESKVAPPLTGDHSWDALVEIKQEAGLHGCDAIVPFAPEKRLYATSNGTPLYKVYQSAACFVFAPG